jgi:membrane peptidoglycan carboxypeptidase
LATALGSSSDRPSALAELMGILLNDGVRLPAMRVTGLRFAAGTPFETAFKPAPPQAERVLHSEVARVLREALAGVVEHGTAQRLTAGLIQADGSRVKAGGKTGSGDNRFRTYAKDGSLVSSQAVNRTAAFVFYIGDKYFGVVTAHVEGQAAARYRFTSALAVTVLKMLSPSLTARLAD